VRAARSTKLFSEAKLAQKPRRKAPVSAPQCPETLTESGREEWLQLAPVAHRAGTLTATSARSFELLVETLGTERKARELVDEAGITVSTGRGGVKPHPAVRTMETARVQAAALLKLFRLEPPNPKASRGAPDQTPDWKSTWRGILR
jgi:P27 family predicted phage terminase small subunit